MPVRCMSVGPGHEAACARTKGRNVADQLVRGGDKVDWDAAADVVADARDVVLRRAL